MIRNMPPACPVVGYLYTLQAKVVMPPAAVLQF